MKTSQLLALSVALTLGHFTASAQTRLTAVGVALGTNTPTTFTIDRTTGIDTPIGPLGDAATLPFGLAVSGGVLYTFDGNTDQIREINPLTGAYTGTPIGINIGNLTGEGDIAFSLDGLTGYLTTAGVGPTTTAPGLYTFNLGAGTSSFVGTTQDSLGALTVDGLATGPGGVLYAITQQDAQLYTLNPTNGFLTPVGPLGVNPNSGFGALTFDNGTLYGIINDTLYTVDPATGNATSVDPNAFGTDFGSVSGLAPAVPEPSTLGLLALGVVGFCARRARRHV